jgi:hypothetical protein
MCGRSHSGEGIAGDVVPGGLLHSGKLKAHTGGKGHERIDMLKKSSHEPVENVKMRSRWSDLLQFVVAVRVVRSGDRGLEVKRDSWASLR